MKKDTKNEESLSKKTENLVNNLLEMMGTQAKATCEFDEENKVLTVNITTQDETGLLIGRRGETLNALQMILGIITKQQTGEWIRVDVNVGDYRQKQEDYLKNLAKETAQKVKETGEGQPIYNLTPAQRRVVHLELSSDETVETESLGEGEERYLVVRPKK
ncbi:KH domain-containing protein [Candidatus Woesebacteria bacterium]|nr:KH domain-containing protein [Candidatus Woesebacteria bacterium]